MSFIQFSKVNSNSLIFSTAVNATNYAVKVTPQTVNAVSFLGTSDQTVLLRNVSNPILTYDAANKNYVDSVVNGLSWKDAVYLTNQIGYIDVTSAPLLVDGVVPYSGSRILINGLTGVFAPNAGIYYWYTMGVPMTRTPDFPSGGDLIEYSASAVFVQAGTTYADTAWVEITDSGVIGVATNVWVQFSSAGAGAAGAEGNIQYRGVVPGSFAASSELSWNTELFELTVGSTQGNIVLPSMVIYSDSQSGIDVNGGDFTINVSSDCYIDGSFNSNIYIGQSISFGEIEIGSDDSLENYLSLYGTTVTICNNNNTANMYINARTSIFAGNIRIGTDQGIYLTNGINSSLMTSAMDTFTIDSTTSSASFYLMSSLTTGDIIVGSSLTSGNLILGSTSATSGSLIIKTSTSTFYGSIKIGTDQGLSLTGTNNSALRSSAMDTFIIDSTTSSASFYLMSSLTTGDIIVGSSLTSGNLILGSTSGSSSTIIKSSTSTFYGSIKVGTDQGLSLTGTNNSALRSSAMDTFTIDSTTSSASFYLMSSLTTGNIIVGSSLTSGNLILGSTSGTSSTIIKSSTSTFYGSIKVGTDQGLSLTGTNNSALRSSAMDTFIIDSTTSSASFYLMSSLTTGNIIVGSSLTSGNLILGSTSGTSSTIIKSSTSTFYGSIKVGTDQGISLTGGNTSVIMSSSGTSFTIDSQSNSAYIYLFPSSNGAEVKLAQNLSNNGLLVLGSAEPSTYAILQAQTVTIGQSNSSTRIIGTANSTSTNSGALVVDGGIGANGKIVAVEFSATSDRRLKKNIQKLESKHSLDLINDINTYQYNWRNNKNPELQYGVIAQELEELGLVNLVNGTETPETYRSVNYIGLIPLLISAIQELKKKIEIN